MPTPVDQQNNQPATQTSDIRHPQPDIPNPRVLVILPAYNEQDTIAAVVTQLHRALPDADVLVVDDGSKDQTARLVPPPARVVRLPMNLGIGGAMQTGYRFAKANGYDLAVQCDADGQHPPELIQPLIDHAVDSGADLVVGSRFIEPGMYQQQPARMAAINWLNRLIGLLGGQRVTDCTSGFRVANRRVIDAFATWYPDDYPEPEAMLRLLRSGFAVSETPVAMKQRQGGVSSIPFRRGLFYVIKVTAALLLTTVREKLR